MIFNGASCASDTEPCVIPLERKSDFRYEGGKTIKYPVSGTYGVILTASSDHLSSSSRSDASFIEILPYRYSTSLETANDRLLVAQITIMISVMMQVIALVITRSAPRQ